MKNKSAINSAIFLLSITVPTAFSAIAAHRTCVTLFIITILGMFLMLKIPLFKHRENLWMFVISTFATIPINIFLVKAINETSFLDYSNVATKILCGFVVYAILFAVEQIVLGLTTRFFFRRQYKLFNDKKKNNLI